MTEARKPDPAFPWWYPPVGGVVTGGALAVPALDFPLNVGLAVAVAAWSGLYLGYQQRRRDLQQGLGQGRRRVVAIAFIVLVLALMVAALAVSFAGPPRAASVALALTGAVVGFFYPFVWQAAG